MKKTIIIFIVFLSAAQVFATVNPARQIMDKVDNVDDGDNRKSKMKMILTDRNGNKRIKYFRSFSKDYGKDSRQIMFIENPPGLKNTGFLTCDYKKPEKDDEQWLFLPALGKAKRIAVTEKDGSFMGSDLNYSDMSQRNLDDYNYKILKELSINGIKHWLIESIPLNDTIVDKTGYKKSILAVRQDNYLISKIIAITSDGNIKTIIFDNLKTIDTIPVFLEIRVITKEGRSIKHKTKIIFSDVKFNQKLKDSLFSLRRLEKGL